MKVENNGLWIETAVATLLILCLLGAIALGMLPASPVEHRNITDTEFELEYDERD